MNGWMGSPPNHSGKRVDYHEIELATLQPQSRVCSLLAMTAPSFQTKIQTHRDTWSTEEMYIHKSINMLLMLRIHEEHQAGENSSRLLTAEQKVDLIHAECWDDNSWLIRRILCSAEAALRLLTLTVLLWTQRGGLYAKQCSLKLMNKVGASAQHQRLYR